MEEMILQSPQTEQSTQTIPKKDKPTVSRKTRKVIGTVIYIAVGVILAVLFLFPLVYMLATSTKDETKYVADAGTLLMFLPDFLHLDKAVKNYWDILTEYGIWRYAMNSFIYAGIVIVLNILINGLAGYVMAKFTFPGKGFFSFVILFLIIVPVETSIIPLYAIVKTMLQWRGYMSVFAIILPSSISVFNIFLFMQFFEGIPKEYEEAARIDGANTMRIFFSMILPLSKPIVATVATFCFIGVWNDYIWPTMILSDERLYPVQSVLETVQGDSAIETGKKMASLVIASVPIFVVYVVAQKYIVQGFGSAGLKM